MARCEILELVGSGMDHFDVVIVGGGPAGSSVANRLALNNRAESALLVERLDGRDFPKYHNMCAEGISRRGLIETGLEFSDIIKNSVKKAIEHWPGNVTLCSDIDGLIIDRNKLITKLREPFLARGGKIKYASVTDVSRQGDRFVVRSADADYSCDYLVGADGAHSMIRKSLFSSEPTTYMRVVQYLVDKPAENHLSFQFDQRYLGKYRWKFPSGKFTKIGYPCGADERPTEVLEEHSRIIPIGPLDHIVEGRACLVGDAASQANPVTFSGIRNGMTAGRMAADAIDEGDLQMYHTRWTSCSLADASFYDSFLRVRNMSNSELKQLVEPLQNDPNFNSIMRKLIVSDDFRSFYRGHIRKLQNGW